MSPNVIQSTEAQCKLEELVSQNQQKHRNIVGLLQQNFQRDNYEIVRFNLEPFTSSTNGFLIFWSDMEAVHTFACGIVVSVSLEANGSTIPG